MRVRVGVSLYFIHKILCMCMVNKCSSSYYKVFCFEHLSKNEKILSWKKSVFEGLSNTTLCKLSPGYWVKLLKYCYNVG